jgi:hypothetical protein
LVGEIERPCTAFEIRETTHHIAPENIIAPKTDRPSTSFIRKPQKTLNIDIDISKNVNAHSRRKTVTETNGNPQKLVPTPPKHEKFEITKIPNNGRRLIQKLTETNSEAASIEIPRSRAVLILPLIRTTRSLVSTPEYLLNQTETNKSEGFVLKRQIMKKSLYKPDMIELSARASEKLEATLGRSPITN